MKYLVLAGLMSAAVAQPTAVIAKELTGAHHPNNSLRADPDKMKWWDEAKFGMFIHWGVYSRLEGAWNGESIPVYAEHIKRTAEIPLDVYRDEVAANFNPVRFNAEEWVKLCKEAGMKYMVITARHHDGFAMFDSNVEGWATYDVVDGTPFARDPMVELKDACDRHGIKFGFYYSQAQDWSHPYGQNNSLDFSHQPRSHKWTTDPEWSDHREKTLEYFVKGKSVLQLKELLSKKYDPDIIWFDTPNWLPADLNAYILSKGREFADPKVIFNSRAHIEFADYISTVDMPTEIAPVRKQENYTPVNGRYYWEAIPTINESYGYHREDNSHKPASHFIVLLSKAAAKGGNLLLNVGPKGDGLIDMKDQKVLKGVGAWMAVNGEAIYGTRKTPLPVPSWGQTSVKGDKLYLHIHNDPGEVLTLGGLKNDVKKAYLLADPDKKALSVKRVDSGDYQIVVPDGSLNNVVSIIVLECAGEIECANSARLLANDRSNILHVFDGEVHGKALHYGRGNDHTNHLQTWVHVSANITWDCRLSADATFNVYAEYDAVNAAKNNRYEIVMGSEALSAKVVPRAHFERELVGQVSLNKGVFPITVNALEIAPKTTLMKLRRLILEPDSLNAPVKE